MPERDSPVDRPHASPRSRLWLGELEIEPPVLLAPMAGFTDWAFRQLVRGLGGAGLLTTEMLCARGLLECIQRGKSLPEQLWGVAGEPRPVGVQLWGREPEVLAEAAGWLVEHLSPSVVDLNFGCPVAKVRVKAGGGAALLAEPELVGRIVARVVQACGRVPVSAKIRLGLTCARVNAVEVAQAIAQAGAASVTVHGRTAEQAFRGRADWQQIARVKAHVGQIAVIGNGDLSTAAEVVSALAEYEVDGVMIGRAARGRPWLFRQAAAALRGAELAEEPLPRQQGEILLEHFRLCCAQYGAERATVLMRRRACCYGEGLRGARGFRTRISRAAGPAQFAATVREFFDR